MPDYTTIFNPVKSSRVFEEVSKEIKKLIFRGILKPGDRLPPELELANQFNVGRQTIREALRILELSGFITVQKGYGGGPLIKDTILARIQALYLDAFQMEKISIDEITVARYKIERMIIQDVITKADEKDWETLRENVKAARVKIEANAIALDENIEFHILLAKATKNHVFVVVVSSILALLQGLLSKLPPDLKVSEAAVSSHEKLLAELMDRDRGKGAERILSDHLESVKSRLQALPDAGSG